MRENFIAAQYTKITVSTINQAIPVLHMTNADATEAFYCGKLGFELVFQLPASETQRDPCYMVFARDTAHFHISSHAGDAVAGGAVLFLTTDVDNLHEQFVANDVTIHVAPVDQTWGMRELYVLDPDGNSVRFTTPIPARA